MSAALAMPSAVTRFAPSPNGPLHLGHAWAVIVAHDRAQADGGTFLLRIEDIDGARSRPELAVAFRADLAWLGLSWHEVTPQSQRLAHYRRAADHLRAAGLLYPCRCTRAEIAAAATAQGPDGPIYPGTCRQHPVAPGADVAWRLDMAKAATLAGPLSWVDERRGEQRATPEMFGDIVLWRKDAPASYHLAATVDDAADGVSVVTRGIDLFRASHVHRLLQALLGLPVPRWHHHAVLIGPDGRKLAKRRDAAGLAERRLAGDDGLALAAALRAGLFDTGICLADTIDLLP
ncbi:MULTISPECIES: tRNA glutamyl-Q(34) synthetase GluQRS [unclassified Novosphingobium]|uniref:tRNA glutamyl-Q(34) synthetase GluQRS n=1 Tax=unclassified Novosphingobium TaxID=2644732 RepID=UPI000D4C48BE|nr:MULTISPECIES: tRNA glutamyl-Q(34) synthetase GluQRS [unclassified Novosphingobium]PTR11519.1 glutamyl-Q tRNA(Asp) synthetase [Novosphingobium sp. GV055]PUB04300.1 glutamyl-Q tRNA(Asp) synthetase [Novosphingobium sp. GV061]PUB20691.1 glutamyl-Q tRNA(Asp) synthetase [Novosphingobium sp. GV079]PUB42417.1 glutamyl-Q tRNA(Asp) synthetase [Novosphingobium sp. GV027]